MDKRRVLFFHTYEDAARIIGHNLGRHGFEVRVVSDPNCDLKPVIKSFRPELLVIEPFLAPNSYYLAASEKLHLIGDPYSMFVPRGLALIESIRQAHAWLPIILYSRYNLGEFAEADRAAIGRLRIESLVEEHTAESALVDAIKRSLAAGGGQSPDPSLLVA